MKIGKYNIDLSNPDKILFPDVGYTKKDLIDYYQRIADIMIPHMKNYPVSMHRFPDGVNGDDFFAKDKPDYFPGWIKSVKFPKLKGGNFEAPVVDKAAALVYLANQAVITPHLYLSRLGNLEYPDRMIFDLDPPRDTGEFNSLRKAAMDLRNILEQLKLKSWIQTTGSKGYHIIVPLDRSTDFDRTRSFAKDIARLLVFQAEDKYTLEQRKNKRGNRIFIDTLRNSYGATAVAPYSVRAKPEAPVATPLDWEEIENGASPRDWTIANIFNRLGQKKDPLIGMMRHRQSISKRDEKLRKFLDREKSAKDRKN